jgi:hypothetical protein
MKLKLLRGTTSKLLRIFVQDTSQTDGRGLTGLAFGSSGLTWYYIPETSATATQVTLQTMTVGTWATGGFKEIDATNLPGFYEIGVPNAALATGGSVAMLLKGAANMVPVPIEIELDAVNYQSATSFGLSNLDAAVSTRSTYAGGDTSGTTTLLGRLTSGRAADLDFLDASISSRSTYAGGDTSGTTSLLIRLTSARASYLDFLSTGVTLAAGGTDPVLIETGVNLRQAMSEIFAVACGESTGVSSGSPVFKAGNNPGTTRLTGTSTNGDRSNITLNLPA